MTDNKARTAATIKSVIYPAGGSFSRILYNFVRKGVIIASCDGRPFDQVLDEAINLGAQDVEEADDGSFRVCDIPGDPDCLFPRCMSNLRMCPTTQDHSKTWATTYKLQRQFGCLFPKVNNSSSDPASMHRKSSKSSTH